MKSVLLFMGIIISTASFASEGLENLMCAIETNGNLTPITMQKEYDSTTIMSGATKQLDAKIYLMKDSGDFYMDVILVDTQITTGGKISELLSNVRAKKLLVSVVRGSDYYQVWCRSRE